MIGAAAAPILYTSLKQCSRDVTSYNRVSMNGGEGVMEVGDVRERYGCVGAGRSLSVVGNSLKPLGPEQAVWRNYNCLVTGLGGG